MTGTFKHPAPVLVTGAHRTGTTWVGKMLAAGSDSSYISEPLNVWHRPGVLRVPTRHWYTYICADNEGEFLPALRETLAFRYHAWGEIRSLRSRKDVGRMVRDCWIFLRGKTGGSRPLLKDPFAVFSAPWFADRLGCRVVITVRHPAAFASSLKRLAWSFDFNDLLNQPLLMRDLLEPHRLEMQTIAPEDVLAQGSLLWKIVYQAVDGYRNAHPEFIIVRHEDLAMDPLEGYRSLYQALDLPFTDRARQAISKSSSSENPGDSSQTAVHTYKLDSRRIVHAWKSRLSEAEISRISSLTGEVASRYYPEVDWD